MRNSYKHLRSIPLYYGYEKLDLTDCPIRYPITAEQENNMKCRCVINTVGQIKEIDMAQSVQVVRFFLAKRYFNGAFHGQGKSGMDRGTCQTVLNKALSVGWDWGKMMNQHPEGFWIICRQDQFARFIIERHQLGNCINGIKDLEPELVQPKTIYERISDYTNVPVEAVKRVVNTLNYSGFNCHSTPMNEIDVTSADCGID